MNILLPVTDNCPFLNQQKGEEGHRNYFMINLDESYGVKLGFELMTLDLQSDVLPTALWRPAFNKVVMMSLTVFTLSIPTP